MRERLPLPRALQNAPELRLGLELYYDAFWDLNTCRPGGGYIAWSVIKDYAACWELSEDQTVDLFAHVRAMDKAFLDWHESKRQTPAGK
jgi:hypothetical protein